MTKSRENIALHQLTKIPPPSFDLDPVSPINNQFYQREEKERSTSNHDNVRKSESRNDVNMREQEIKHIFGSSYHDSDEYKDNSEMCDTACQTRYVKLRRRLCLFCVPFPHTSIHSSRQNSFRLFIHVMRENFARFFHFPHAQFLSFHIYILTLYWILAIRTFFISTIQHHDWWILWMKISFY